MPLSKTLPDTSRALWIEAPGRAALRSEPLSPPAAGTSLVRVEYGAVSVGTERLVARGGVPREVAEQMACRGMGGGFALPIKYGYSVAGSVLEGALQDERVFCMHPHQDLVRVPDAHCVVLPENVPTRRAVLFPNLETALNGVWDAGLESTPAGPVAVLGAGAVGLLCGFALSEEHAVPVTVVEPDAERRRFASELPWVARALHPEQLEHELYARTLHTSGTSAGLQLALEALAFEGRAIELSWYGDRPVELALGGSFHTRRLGLIASQVAHVAAPRRAAGFAARTARVLELLADPRLDALLEDSTAFQDLPALFAGLHAGAAVPPVPLVRYGS